MPNCPVAHPWIRVGRSWTRTLQEVWRAQEKRIEDQNIGSRHSPSWPCRTLPSHRLTLPPLWPILSRACHPRPDWDFVYLWKHEFDVPKTFLTIQTSPETYPACEVLVCLQYRGPFCNLELRAGAATCIVNVMEKRTKELIFQPKEGKGEKSSIILWIFLLFKSLNIAMVFLQFVLLYGVLAHACPLTWMNGPCLGFLGVTFGKLLS